MSDGDHDPDETLPGRPDPEGLDARLALAQLREQMFHAATPIRLERHRLVRLLGRGAHGRVFEAEDTELRRTIALKVMRADDPTSPLQRTWLREAQSLAKLSHPHVVEVYDVGITDGELWIAMELVRGSTVAQWAQQHPPGSRERFDRIRDILDQVASGVAAAHERGLVHRDLKPSNVLVGDDGRARVADFGLARPRLAETEPMADADPNAGEAMTAIAGTPRYMSPEQLRGERVDAASDLFGFAVMAWELVYGTHPFAGVEPATLARAEDLPPVAAPSRNAVPRAYARALRRALVLDPSRRIASMDELRRALRPPSRARWVAAIGGGAAALATTALLVRPPASAEPWPPSCEPSVARASLAEAWDEERRNTVEAGLLGSGLVDASAVTRTVTQRLDAYADAWVSEHTTTCEARWEARTIDDTRLDARVSCLHHAAERLDAVLDLLETADRSTAALALASVRSLPSPHECAAADLPSPDRGPRHDALRRRLADARADLAAGRYASASTKAEAIAAEATVARLGTLAADAHELTGIAWGELYDPRRFAAFEAAYYLAAELTDGRDLARHANSLAMQYAYRGRLEEAEEWARHAEAGLRRRPDPLQRLTTEHVRGLVLFKRDELPAATATFEHVLAELHDPPPEADDLAWRAGLALLSTYRNSNRLDETTALAERLRAQTVETFGPSHPRLARISLALASSARKRGDLAEAIEHLEEAVRISEQGYGPGNPRTAEAYLELGWTYVNADDLATAERSYERGLAAAGEIDGPFRVRLLRGLALACSSRGDLSCAEARLQTAVSVGRRLWPDGSPELDRTTRQLAEVLLDRGTADEAAHHLRTTLPGLETAPQEAELARTVAELARAAAMGAEVPELPALRERALATCGSSTSSWCERLRDEEDAPPAASGPDGRQ